MTLRGILKACIVIAAVYVVWMVGSLLMCVYTRGGSYVIKLPGDYEIGRSHGDQVSIFRISDSSGVIAPPVDAFAVRGRLVIGHVGKPERGEESDYGYFIIDTRAQGGKVQHGLSRKVWLTRLREYGIRSAPTLHRPCGLVRWRRCDRPRRP